MGGAHGSPPPPRLLGTFLSSLFCRTYRVFRSCIGQPAGRLPRPYNRRLTYLTGPSGAGVGGPAVMGRGGALLVGHTALATVCRKAIAPPTTLCVI